MFVLNKTVCLFLLAIILIILVYNNWNHIQPFVEGLTVEWGDVEKTTEEEQDTTTDNTDINKIITSATNLETQRQTLAVLDSEITAAQNSINEIKAALPFSIDDIIIGDIQVTDDVNDVNISIITSNKTTLDPITNEDTQTAIWVLNPVLPRGLNGPEGPRGPKGFTGEQGVPGDRGSQGRQGTWSSCNSD